MLLPCVTEKVTEDGENDKAGAAVTVTVTVNVASVYPSAEAVTVEAYVPGARSAEFTLKDSSPRAAEGKRSQLLLADLSRVTAGEPVLAERAAD